MVNVMNKVLRDGIPDISMLFLDDIPMKGCSDDANDKSIVANGCRRFVRTTSPTTRKYCKGLRVLDLPSSGRSRLLGNRRSLIRTSRDMGHVREAEREVLVVGNV